MMPAMPTVMHVVGARPNFVKIAPLIDALRAYPDVRQRLVHTGQHHDRRMAGTFFAELDLPAPDHDLGVGGGTHAEQTGRAMVRLEAVVEAERPDLLVAVGDVNSALAAALVAAKAHVPLVHLEAGLRSFDATMPEEINRIVVDRLSTVLLAPTAESVGHLLAEGRSRADVYEVGNLMIDTLRAHRPAAPWPEVAASLGLTDRGYAVLTLHRPATVDRADRLLPLLARVAAAAGPHPIVFPVHPRTAARLAAAGAAGPAGLHVIEPLGYRAFVALMDHASCVLTDSGGIQAETTALGVPCLTLRDQTEWGVTVDEGTNTLVMSDGRHLASAFDDIVRTGGKRGRGTGCWDGHAAPRAARLIAAALTTLDPAATLHRGEIPA
jgi:UDP-N-acetylglucosamine 2-epimerase (non-hydrolysing)